MLVLVLAQTAMPTSVYAKGFGGAVSHPGGVTHYGGGTYYGGGTHPSGWYYPSPVTGRPMTRPAAPMAQQRSGYVSGGAGPMTSPYYYYYSDAYYNYYYCYYNGRYYYYCQPRQG
jgi:hypothetical protein